MQSTTPTGKMMTQTGLRNAVGKNSIWYASMPSVQYSPDCGTYTSYDIAAYDLFRRNIVSAIRDVTPDRRTALRIVETFNRCQLAPCHLKDAILDILS